MLCGLGIGTTLFGLLFLVLSFRNDQQFNIGALVAIISGSICIFMALNLKTKTVEQE
ncbi:hypothetical protein [Colwellia sp. TT2012]|uniref:hypothetical protein n=1 Tax=Colwellia sp. TT2012 TaxID=1720342 RepID=UPI000B2B1D03|nr:hypothetical protein [Colwellia sp. TT2012]